MRASKIKYKEKEKAHQKFQVITLKDLAFAFKILGIGLAISTVVFFVEVWKGRKLLITTENCGWNGS